MCLTWLKGYLVLTCCCRPQPRVKRPSIDPLHLCTKYSVPLPSAPTSYTRMKRRCLLRSRRADAKIWGLSVSERLYILWAGEWDPWDQWRGGMSSMSGDVYGLHHPWWAGKHGPHEICGEDLFTSTSTRCSSRVLLVLLISSCSRWSVNWLTNSVWFS